MFHLFVLAKLVATTTTTAGKLSITPSTGLPGTNSLQALLNGLAGTILVLGGIGFIAGVAFKAVGAHGGNLGLSDTGGRMMTWGAFACFLAGAAAVIVNFFFGLGTSAH